MREQRAKLRRPQQKNRKAQSSAEEAVATVVGCVAFLVVVMAIDVAFAFLAMLAWNAVMPALFHLPQIAFWQMWLLLALIGLIGGFFRGMTTSQGSSR